MQSTLTDQQVGTPQMAAAIASWHGAIFFMSGGEQPAGVDYLDRGGNRCVYLDKRAGVVYKIGSQSANRQEVRTLAELRERGVEHAPAATLHTVRIWDGIGGEWETQDVVAMPYLPEDGSVPHAGITLEGAGDLNPANVHANGGRLWLIDAGGM